MHVPEKGHITFLLPRGGTTSVILQLQCILRIAMRMIIINFVMLTAGENHGTFKFPVMEQIYTVKNRVYIYTYYTPYNTNLGGLHPGASVNIHPVIATGW